MGDVACFAPGSNKYLFDSNISTEKNQAQPILPRRDDFYYWAIGCMVITFGFIPLKYNLNCDMQGRTAGG